MTRSSVLSVSRHNISLCAGRLIVTIASRESSQCTAYNSISPGNYEYRIDSTFLISPLLGEVEPVPVITPPPVMEDKVLNFIQQINIS